MSFSQALRKILDAPFAKKGLIFWLFSPILFLISFVFAIVGKYRRQKGYASFEKLSVPMPDYLHVMCVGNILVGGTGKSPLVRHFAMHYLENDKIVAIAARGIGAQPVMLDSFHTERADIDNLSDENREHFEILRQQFPSKQFFIFQNKHRQKSLCKFIEIIAKLQNKKCVLILDDGLQHFSCPRHVNICVCDSQLNLTAPAYALPVGPYREGFGRKSLQNLIKSFDVRIWTNLNKPHVDVLQQSDTPISMDAAIPQLAIAPWLDDGADAFIPRGDGVIPRPDRGIQDISAHYELRFVKFHILDDGTFNFESIAENRFSFQKNDHPLIIAGIAHPERFFTDLKSISPQFELCSTVFLADHGQLDQYCLEQIEQSKIIFLTLKDFFRFCTNQTFLKLCAARNVYGCYPEYKLVKFI